MYRQYFSTRSLTSTTQQIKLIVSLFALLAWPCWVSMVLLKWMYLFNWAYSKCTPNKFNAMISSWWGYLIILSSDCHWPTDWPSGWLAGCEETNVCRFLIFFPLCIICRYLPDSQDQHVSRGGSALNWETWWIWIECWRTTEGICCLSTLRKGHRDLMNL